MPRFKVGDRCYRQVLGGQRQLCTVVEDCKDCCDRQPMYRVDIDGSYKNVLTFESELTPLEVTNE